MRRAYTCDASAHPDTFFFVDILRNKDFFRPGRFFIGFDHVSGRRYSLLVVFLFSLVPYGQATGDLALPECPRHDEFARNASF